MSELKRFCPQETKINLGTLSRALTNLNSRVRNQGLSASQIHFSRDLVTGENLHLNDKILKSDRQEKRQANQISSAKSKTPKGKILTKPEVQPGNIVHVKNQGSKHDCRDPYMVMGKSGSKVTARRMLQTAQAADRGPTLSHEVCNIDQKFLFTAPSKPRTNPSVLETARTPYIIPQRRFLQAAVQGWVLRQSFGYDDSDAACSVTEDMEEDENTVESEEEELDRDDDSFIMGETFTISEHETEAAQDELETDGENIEDDQLARVQDEEAN